MGFNFPNSPAVGAIYATWQWDGEKWISLGGAQSPAPAQTLEGNPTAAAAPLTPFTISSLTAKSPPIAADQVLIEDSTTSPPSLKRSSASGFGGGLTAPAQTLRGNPTGATATPSDFTIGGLANKAAPASADLLIAQDSVTGALRNILIGAITDVLTNQAAWSLWGNPTGASATPIAFTVHGLALKATPVAADEVMLADSAASFGLKRAALSTVTSAVNTMAASTFKGNPTGSPALPTDFTIDGLTLKSTPVGADEVMIADSAAAFGMKKIPLSSFPASFGTSPAQTLRGNPTGAAALYTDFTISSLTNKAVPLAADNVLIEDSTTTPPSLKRAPVSGISASASTGAVRYDSAQGLTAAQGVQGRQNIFAAPFDALAFNGIQFNGSMEVSQERGGALTAANIAPLDGWILWAAGTMGVGAQQVADAPPGYTKSLKVTVTIAQAAMTANDYVVIQHAVEGYRASRLGWGAASGVPLSIGFWAKAHRTGLYSATVMNASPYNREWPFTFTIVAADTWEWKTTTVSPETTGTWNTTNTGALYLLFAMAAGSARVSAAGSWNSPSQWSPGATGTLNGVAFTTDTFQIAGVIMLPGIELPPVDRAPFIMRPFDQELMLSRRYYQSTFPYGTPPSNGSTITNGCLAGNSGTFSSSGALVMMWDLAPEMRASPTVNFYNPQTSGAGLIGDLFGGGSTLTPGAGLASTKHVKVAIATGSGVTFTPAVHAVADARM
jgi:hypothetical protein